MTMKPPPPIPGDVRFRDAKRGGSGHGGVDGVASFAKDLDSGPGGVRVNGCNRAALSDGDGLPRGRRRSGGGSDHEEREEHCTRDRAENPGTHTAPITETVKPKPGPPRVVLRQSAFPSKGATTAAGSKTVRQLRGAA